jgi:hypothetical protein
VLLTGKKPNVSYFGVFGSNCFILNKKTKNSKFASKVDEGFLLGYASNAHGYCVFNNSSGCVEIACDVTFDEYNGSQKEQVDLNDADDELAPQQAIENLTTGEIRPREKNDQETSKDGPNTTAAENSGVSSQICKDSAGSEDFGHISENSRDADEDVFDQDKADEDDEPVQHQAQAPHPRVHQSMQCNHLVDNILGSIQRGVTTCSRLANFYEHYSFVYSLEPLKVEEALGDADWAMQEELKYFTRNEVWSLVERPKQNMIGTK